MASAETAPYLEAGYLDGLLFWSEELVLAGRKPSDFWLKLFLGPWLLQAAFIVNLAQRVSKSPKKNIEVVTCKPEMHGVNE